MKLSFRTITRLLALFVLSTCLSWWWFSGADMGWTKTYVTIPATDEITGIQYEVKQEKFVPGVDFVAAGIGLSFGIFAASFLPSPRKPKIQKP
ncbi:MAG: hypothetical protein EBY32_02605 [Proteobacteria bacterium]|nr:hypothetical protein [Pseudomonadota bacterium]